MGRHHSRGTMVPVPLTLGGAVLVVALVVAGFAYDRRDSTAAGNGSACASLVRVVTASSYAPVIDRLAPVLASGQDCVRLDVSVVDGRAAGGRVAQIDADVWIPDDAAWVATAADVQLAPKNTLRAGTVLATSPIFMVTDAATAGRLTGLGGSWLALAGLVRTEPGVRLALPEPSGSGDGLVAAGAVGEGVWLAKGMDASSVALAGVRPRSRTVPGTGPALPDQPGEVGLVPEYALLGNLPKDAVYLAGTDRTALLRYTWLPTAAAAADKERAAGLNRLLDALLGTLGERAVAAARLRGPEVQPITDAPVSPLPGVTAKPFDTLGAHHVDHVFATWYAADRRTSVLMAIDVSGSMGQPATGAGAPVIDLVKQGCLQVAALLPDDARLGLWEFGHQIAPPNDYRSVLPLTVLTADHRAVWTAAVSGLTARSDGTGLYDTILAAYLDARNNYQPGVDNHVFVFTDGRNDDTGSITLPALTDALNSAKDPARPVQLSIVAFGGQALVDQLGAVVRPVGGYVGAAQTADEVQAVFIHVAAGGIHE